MKKQIDVYVYEERLVGSCMETVLYGFAKRIGLLRADTSIMASIEDYIGNPLPYEPISIRITGESTLGEALEPFEGICEDGVIDLNGYVAGDKLLIETLNETVENATLEVTV